MLYTLYLERRALIAAVFGFSVFGLFLFFAGYLVGSRSAAVKAAAEAPGEDADAQAAVAGEPLSAEDEGGRPRAAPLFGVQIGAFATREEALAFQQDQEQRGYQPFMTTIRSELQARRLFSVRLGPFATESEAEKAADRFRTDEKLGTFVVRLPLDSSLPVPRRQVDEQTDASK